MISVTYNDRCLKIDGKPIWLVSGSVHYFRVPSSLWRDRLLKAKRAGLNCIDTYVAWNFHEPQEGTWRFSGDYDVVEFVRLAGELGLKVILRPGPYICSEWDFGGLPAWLTTKSGIAYRTANATYMHYFDKYFRQVLPRLADLQVTRGGNIILIQNENEYIQTAMPDRLNYLEFISQLIRRSGFEVPIVTCNLLSAPRVPGAIECANGWGGLVGTLKQLRASQPNTPLMVTEFWDGWMDYWGGEHVRRDAYEVARRALAILGCGAQFNYYMFHGGTNFAFWGSKHALSSASYQTTSYDHDAPIAEGGGLTGKYYITKLINMLANHMGPFFAQATMREPGANILNAIDVMHIQGPQGGWVIVTTNGKAKYGSALISLPSGVQLNVPLEPLGGTAVPVGLALTDQCTLDYSTLMPLGFFAQRYLILHGPAGWRGQLSVNGQVAEIEVPSADEPKMLTHQGLELIVVNSDLATRTWVVDDEILFGPRFVGESVEQVVPQPGSRQFAALSVTDGKLTHRKVKQQASSRQGPPRLGGWNRLCVCTEPASKLLGWVPMDKPTGVDTLGNYYGYTWYRLEKNYSRPVKRNIFLPDCEDRATIYCNGELVGVWGRGSGATRRPIPVSFRQGLNVLVMLVDNLGRPNIAPNFGELKGLHGQIYDAKPLRLPKPRIKQAESFPKRIIPRNLSHILPRLEQTPCWRIEINITLNKVSPVHLSFADVPYDVAVLCNDRVAGIYPSYWTETNFGDAALGPMLKKGKNVVTLLVWGKQPPKNLDAFRIYQLPECISEDARWSWRSWQVPPESGHMVGKDQPAWYRATFGATDPDLPLFVKFSGIRKGQLFLNGHNIGRVWAIGPQERYYLPAC